MKNFYLSLSLTLLAACQQTPTAQVEPGEELAGGATTVFDTTPNAFGLSARNMSAERRSDFFVGNSFFKQNWVTSPASTTGRDGLGPHFNTRSCSSCHFKDGRGEPPAPGENMVSMLVRISVEGMKGEAAPHPIYGDQLQNNSVPDAQPEVHATLSWKENPGTFPDGETYTLREPKIELKNPAYGPLPENLLISPRVAPHMIGMGLLEAIPERVLLQKADPDDKDKDGISGKPNYTLDLLKKKKVIGRFGWKAGQPTVHQQVAAAFNGDIGITSTLFSKENHSAAQKLDHLPNGGNPEISDRILKQVSFYSATLAVPARRNVDNPQVLRGKHLFTALDCASCHTPSYTTGELPGFPELSNQKIYPYTDLLLHDMGEGLADNRPDLEASGREWRTPPLWGLGLVPHVNKHSTLLHDGRARGFQEAILWHGGEAEASKNRYKLLPQKDRDALLKFLESL